MAQQHVNQSRDATTKTAGEATPRQSARAFLGNGSHRQAGPSPSVTDFSTSEHFNHLKLAAEEKIMQEQATSKSDLQILKSKLQKAEEQVRSLESKVQDMNNENATLKVQHNQDMKLWNGLDSKFLSTTIFCDQLAETLQLLDSQVQQGERTENYLGDKLAERLQLFESTERRLKDLLVEQTIAENTLKQCEAKNLKLQCTIQEMEQTLQFDSINYQKLSVEKDDLQQQLTEAIKANQDNEATIRSTRCDIQELQSEIISKAKEATHLQNLNFTLMQGKGELELEVKDLQNLSAARLKDSEAVQHESELLQLKITDLEKVNARATVDIENLLAEISKLKELSTEDKISHEKLVTELRQQLLANDKHAEAVSHQLREAVQENQRLVAVLSEAESTCTSLQDEINRLCQEHADKLQIISRMSHDEESLRRENTMTQVQLTAAENLVKCLEEKFNLQLQAQQEESRKNLQDLSQRTRMELVEAKTKYEAELKEAIRKEMLKGEDRVNAVKQASDESMKNALEAINQRWQSFQEDCERRSNLREIHDEEKTKIDSIHGDEMHRKDEELQKLNEEIIKLREHHKEEKEKIVSTYVDEIHRKEEELHRLNETISKLREAHANEKNQIASYSIGEIHGKDEELHKLSETISKLREDHEEEINKLREDHEEEVKIASSIYVDEVQRKDEELHRLSETINKLREDHEEEVKIASKIYVDEVQGKEEELQSLNETISKLREGHEDEKLKIASSFVDEVDRKEEDLHKLNETISQLREGLEDEKVKIASSYVDKMHRKEEELHRLHESIIKHRQRYDQDLTKMRTKHADQIRLNVEELHKVKERIRELEVGHTEEKAKIVAVHAEEILSLQAEVREVKGRVKQYEERHEHAKTKMVAVHAQEIRKMQERLHTEQMTWRSKALGWETQLQKNLEENTTKKASKENEHSLNEDFQMQPVTEEPESKDIPTAVVTPITKDKEPQQNKRSAIRTIHLEDTTDEEAEEGSKKPAPQPQEKCYVQKGVQRSQRLRKRKVNDANPPEEAHWMNGKSPWRKGTVDTQDKKTIEHHQESNSTDSTKAVTDDGSSGNKQISKAKNNLPQQQKVIMHRHSDDYSRRNTGRNTGLRCTQDSDLHSIPGPTKQKETNNKAVGIKKTAPSKRTGRKSKTDVSPVNEFSKALSPAISDLFQVDGLPVYYKGDDPYAFT